MELINVKDLISELKKRGTDLGKGNPYNRLRYYTKIGWIDHMVRKKDENGVVIGHYPINVIEKIVEIENLKKSGKSNEEISKHINNKENSKKNLDKFNLVQYIKSKFNINILIIILIIFGFIFELNNYNSLNDKLPINKDLEPVLNTESKIIEKGKNTIPSGKNKIFINSRKINEKSVVFITFESSIEPATTYFVNKKIIEEGFNIETNIPVRKDVNFSWVIVN